MLRKLLKHEFRATGRIMGPLYLVLLALSACANGSVRILDNTDNRFLNIIGGLILTLFGVAIFAVFIITLVMMINRFRTNLLGDEGYVMLTLPASVHEQVWSKILVSTVWTIASFVMVGLSAVVATFRVDYVNRMISWLKHLFDQITSYYAFNGAAFALEFLVLLFLGCAAFCLQFYAAMAVGHSFANHKTLLSVVFFFVFQFVMQTLGISGLMGFQGFQLSDMASVHAFMGILIAATLVYGTIFYIITTMMMKKHLNLE
jgi:hypothetical protein